MLTFISFGHCTWKAFMCQSLSAFSLGCWCYLCDSTSSFLLHLFFFVDVVFFFFYSSLVKTMDALSLFSFAVFSRLSGKAFLPSSCFRQAFFFNALSITHHPHFVPEQLFPFLSLCGESMTQCCTLHELM